MQILRAQPLRRQVIAATVVLLVFFVVAALISAIRTWREAQQDVQTQARSIATTAGAYLDLYLNGLDSMASALTQHPAIIALDGAKSDALFANVLRGQSGSSSPFS